MKLSFKKRELEIDLYGEPIKLGFPTVGQYRKYQAKLIKGETSDTEVTVDLLIELGMPADKLDDLEPAHLNEIMSTLVGDKKK